VAPHEAAIVCEKKSASFRVFDRSVHNGYWIDQMNGYWWQDPPPKIEMTWQNAMNYCDNLVLGGKSDWRLPSISELRSLIHGCAVTQVGGDCGVIDSCLCLDCTSNACVGCYKGQGPGKDGCYWDIALKGDCSVYFSSSDGAYGTDTAWFVNFENGVVNFNTKPYTEHARCVRSSTKMRPEKQIAARDICGQHKKGPIDVGRYSVSEPVKGESVVKDIKTGFLWQGTYFY
jgi:hypothetical protein